MEFSCFHILRGNAEAFVRSDGKVNHHLIVYLIGNVFDKSNKNLLMYSEVIAN